MPVTSTLPLLKLREKPLPVEVKRRLRELQDSDTKKQVLAACLTILCLAVLSLGLVVAIGEISGGGSGETADPAPDPAPNQTTTGPPPETTIVPPQMTPPPFIGGEPQLPGQGGDGGGVSVWLAANQDFGNGTCRALWSYTNEGEQTVVPWDSLREPLGSMQLAAGTSETGVSFLPGYHFGALSWLWRCGEFASQSWNVPSLGISAVLSAASTSRFPPIPRI